MPKRRYHSFLKCCSCGGRLQHSFAVRDEQKRLFCKAPRRKDLLKKELKRNRWERKRGDSLRVVT